MSGEFIPYSIISNQTYLSNVKNKYPYLQDKEVNLVVNEQPNSGYLEFYPPGEVGSKKFPRPPSFPIEEAGIEIRSRETKPLDVLGDYVSHYGIYNDPVLVKQYNELKESLTPQQKAFLKRQYNDYQQGYYIDEEGSKVELGGELETRPYEQWEETSGLPGFYRGYLLNQWDNAKEMYTPEQIEEFNKIKSYLGIND